MSGTGDGVVRRLLPEAAEERLDGLYRDLDLPARSGRPYVYVGMVASVDGVAEIGGVSGPLGGSADRQAFRGLRACADAVLVGAATVRKEDYRAVQLPVALQERRLAEDRAPVPPVVVVTRGADLDPAARLFTDPDRRPIVIVPEAAPNERVERLRPVADVVQIGGAEVDLRGALLVLANRGYERVLCEGGPSVVGQLVDAGLVDELFLTLAPKLVGEGRRLVGTTLAHGPAELQLLEVREHAGELLLRYGVGGPAEV